VLPGEVVFGLGLVTFVAPLTSLLRAARTVCRLSWRDYVIFKRMTCPKVISPEQA
jgi:hypothetical protein